MLKNCEYEIDKKKQPFEYGCNTLILTNDCEISIDFCNIWKK